MSKILKGLDEAFGRYGRRDAYQRDYDASVAGMNKRDSYAYQMDGGANDEGWDEPQRDYTPKPVARKGMYFYNVPTGQEDKANEVGLFRTKSGKWYSPFQNTRADMFFGKGRYWEPKTNESQLSELSNDTLASYKKKAGADASAADKAGDYKRGDKRMSGIVKATKKQFDNDAKGVAEGEAPLKHHTARVSYHKEGDPHRRYEAIFKTTHNGGKEETEKRAKAAFAAKKKIVYDIVHEQGVAEEKQRLDPKCWKGYKKQGTKMKGDTRVNNCVPVSESSSSILEGLQQIDEINWKHAAAAGAMALGALGGAGQAQAQFNPAGLSTVYLQQVAAGEHQRPMVSVDAAKAELQARADGKQQKVSSQSDTSSKPITPVDYQTKEPLKQGPDGKWYNSSGEERDSLHGGPVSSQGTAMFRSLKPRQ